VHNNARTGTELGNTAPVDCQTFLHYA
jgi:hypothetical protein